MRRNDCDDKGDGKYLEQVVEDRLDVRGYFIFQSANISVKSVDNALKWRHFEELDAAFDHRFE